MADSVNTPASGVQLDVAGKKFIASHDTVTAALGTLERMWSRALDWMDDNPIQFGLLVVLIMFAIVQRRKSRTDLASMKTEFELKRETIRSQQQQSLPLPSPDTKAVREISK